MPGKLRLPSFGRDRRARSSKMAGYGESLKKDERSGREEGRYVDFDAAPVRNARRDIESSRRPESGKKTSKKYGERNPANMESGQRAESGGERRHAGGREEYPARGRRSSEAAGHDYQERSKGSRGGRYEERGGGEARGGSSRERTPAREGASRGHGRSDEWRERPRREKREDEGRAGAFGREYRKGGEGRPYSAEPRPRFEKKWERREDERPRRDYSPADKRDSRRPPKAYSDQRKPAGFRGTHTFKPRERDTYKSADRYVEMENMPVRLNKVLADAGVASRRKADELIAEGVVRVNGRVVTDLGVKVYRTDTITVNGDPIKEFKRLVYILLNKPKDFITTTSDELDRKTVMDLIKTNERIYPVGRLDRNTTGVLLLTNDGELAHRLTHPSFEIERIYNVLLDKELEMNYAQAIADGVELEEGKTGPCDVYINPENKAKVILALREGKNREVRRIFESFGYVVKQLDRKYFAGLTTKGLERGQYRQLMRSEVIALQRLTGIK